MPDFELAGAQTMLENLVNELDKNENIDVLVCSFFSMKSQITERIEKNNIPIYYLGKHKGLDPIMLFKLARLLKKIKPDVIHTHRYSLKYIMPALKISKLKGVKIIHTLHSIATMEVPKRLQKKQNRWFMEKKVIPVAISNGVKDSMKQIYEIHQSEIPIIYNGIPLEKCLEKRDYHLKNKILHIGRFSDVKNHKELISLFEKLVEKNKLVNLELIGTGILESEIKKQVKNLGLESKVHFLGTKASCYNNIHECDIFILPSKYEGMPMTLIEAMGSGVPVVTRPIGGIPDMITNGIDGYLCEEVKDMKDIVLNLLENESERERIGKNARERSKCFSSKIMMEEYLKLYRGEKNDKN